MKAITPLLVRPVSSVPGQQEFTLAFFGGCVYNEGVAKKDGSK
jgi:hypothetical protein